MARQVELTDEQTVRLRAIVKRELMTVVPKQLHLAPMLGVKQSTLSKFLDGAPGGFVIAVRTALLLKRPIEDVLGVSDIGVLVDPQHARYPSRIYAARAAYLNGVPLARIRAILTTSLEHSGDPGANAWMKMMVSDVVMKPGSREGTQWALDRVRPKLKKGKKRGSRARSKS